MKSGVPNLYAMALAQNDLGYLYLNFFFLILYVSVISHLSCAGKITALLDSALMVRLSPLY